MPSEMTADTFDRGYRNFLLRVKTAVEAHTARKNYADKLQIDERISY